MSNFVEKPILLITEQFELNKDGIDFIKSLSDKKITIISVIGPKSSGKSFLSNQLVGIFNNGFDIGSIENRTECCTKGIWVWGKPLIINESYVLILDSQGFQTETEEKIKYNQKVFILLNLISSLVIYNYKKDDESEDNKNISEQVLKNSYELFFKIIQIFDDVKLDKNSDNKLSNDYISNYCWLFRDYSIDDFSKYNDLINTLVQGNDNYNNLFKNKINYSSLPTPMEENEMLINLYLDEEDDGKGGPFDDEYKKKFDEFKKKLLTVAGPKNIGGSPMNNSILELLLNDYSKCLSSNETLYVSEPLNKLINEELDKIKTIVVEKIKSNLNEKNGNINDISLKIKNSFDILSDKAFDAYGESKIANNYIIENINKIIDLFGKELIEKYINNNITEYNDVINNIIKERENSSSLLSNNITKKEDIKTLYNSFIEETKKDLDNNIFNTKYEFINSFPLLKNYLEKCVFNHTDTYINKIDTFFDATMKEQQEKASQELNKIVEEKNNEINNQKEQIEKMASEIKDLKDNIESKEKEYTNDLNKKKEEYEKLEQEKKVLQDNYNTLESEKKDLLEKNENLQKNLDDLTNKNKELEQQVNDFIEKEKRKPKPQMVNVKEEDLPKLVELFNEIETVTKEYNDTMKLFSSNKAKIFFHDKYIEESKNNINDNCSGWVEELKKITKERLETKDNSNTQEIENLKKENKKINDELNKVKEEMEKIKDERNNFEEQLKLNNDIKADIEQYKKDLQTEMDKLKKSNALFSEQIIEKENKIKSKTLDLNMLKTDYSVKEKELKEMMNSFRCLLEKNKKDLELHLKKLPPNFQEEIKELGKRHKLIK